MSQDYMLIVKSVTPELLSTRINPDGTFTFNEDMGLWLCPICASPVVKRRGYRISCYNLTCEFTMTFMKKKTALKTRQENCFSERHEDADQLDADQFVLSIRQGSPRFLTSWQQVYDCVVNNFNENGEIVFSLEHAGRRCSMDVDSIMFDALCEDARVMSLYFDMASSLIGEKE